MLKDTHKITIFRTLAVLVCSAFLSALSIVFGKYLSIPVGSMLRFGFESTPIMLGGMIFGPVVGAAIGLVADLVGCVLVGYEINPLVTLGCVLIGALAGFVYRILKKHTSLKEWLAVAISVAIAHLIGSVTVKTAGLAAYYGMPYLLLMLWRLLNYIIVGVCDATVISVLLKSSMFKKQVNSILRKK